MIRPYTALLDANIFYPAPLRDLMMQLAVQDMFHGRWTEDIHREWIEALLRTKPHLERARLEATRDLINASTRDALITGYEAIIPTLELPDPNDRHVLAAAIVGRCDVIVTVNLRHFPNTALAPFQIEAQHPNVFLCNHLDLAPDVFCEAVRKVRGRLRNPPYSVDEYLDTLARQGLNDLSEALREIDEPL